jgi:hypothetical protein
MSQEFTERKIPDRQVLLSLRRQLRETDLFPHVSLPAESYLRRKICEKEIKIRVGQHCPCISYPTSGHLPQCSEHNIADAIFPRSKTVPSAANSVFLSWPLGQAVGLLPLVCMTRRPSLATSY